MSVNNDRKGERVDAAFASFRDELYWTLVERLTEFVSTPLRGSTYSVRGVVRLAPSVARIFVFDGTNFSTTVGVDCPLLDENGGQISHFHHLVTLRRAIQAFMDSVDADIVRDVDSHGFPIFDAHQLYRQGRGECVTLGDAIFGAIAATLHTFGLDSPSMRDSVIYPVGFLTVSTTTVRVYFRIADTLETLGFDVNISDDAGNFKLVSGTFLWAHIRELVDTNSLAGREVDVSVDEYCSRAFSMP